MLSRQLRLFSTKGVKDAVSKSKTSVNLLKIIKEEEATGIAAAKT